MREKGDLAMTDEDLYTDFERVLRRFSEESNSNEKVLKLIKRWSTSVLIWPEALRRGFLLTVENGKIIRIESTDDRENGRVKVVGQRSVLSNMFEGRERIAHLYMEGIIQTYGSEKDQIVLDAIARILWN